ncbi:MAG: twin-arginine translocation signal domain-containing protein [Gemmatimonadota bacterium]
MTSGMSRRDLLQLGGTTAAAALAGLGSGPAKHEVLAAVRPTGSKWLECLDDHFYRDDWLGKPWRKPEAAVLIRSRPETRNFM